MFFWWDKLLFVWVVGDIKAFYPFARSLAKVEVRGNREKYEFSITLVGSIQGLRDSNQRFRHPSYKVNTFPKLRIRIPKSLPITFLTALRINIFSYFHYSTNIKKPKTNKVRPDKGTGNLSMIRQIPRPLVSLSVTSVSRVVCWRFGITFCREHSWGPAT